MVKSKVHQEINEKDQ